MTWKLDSVKDLGATIARCDLCHKRLRYQATITKRCETLNVGTECASTKLISDLSPDLISIVKNKITELKKRAELERWEAQVAEASRLIAEDPGPAESISSPRSSGNLLGYWRFCMLHGGLQKQATVSRMIISRYADQTKEANNL